MRVDNLYFTGDMEYLTIFMRAPLEWRLLALDCALSNQLDGFKQQG